MPPHEELTVCFWNILFDVNQPSKVKAQSDRLPSIIDDLRRLPSKTIIGLAEVEDSNGKRIASELQANTEYFVENHRDNNHIGVVSRLKLTPTFFNLDEMCKVVLVRYKDINIIIVHSTLILFGDSSRKKQIRKLLSGIDTTLPTVIMGDFNSLYWQGSRRLLNNAGFRSALDRSFIRRLPTAPTRAYRHILPQPLKALALRGFTLDDIYVKGLDVQNSGTFEGESDHRGVWAKLQLTQRRP